MILTLAGSNSKESINQEVAQFISDRLHCFYYDTRRIDIPVYNRDEKIVSEIANLYNLICEYEVIICVIPEYNGNFPSFFKNIVDELSVYDRNFLTGKQLFIVSATPGKKSGESVRQIGKECFKFFGADVIKTYGIGEYESINHNMEEIVKVVEDINSYLL